MSSSSTNKQPMLIDRPLQAFATLGANAALSVSTNLTTVLGSGCVLAVDCGSNDGACIDSVIAIAGQSGLTSVSALVFLSTAASATLVSPSNTVCIASAVVGSASMGQVTNIPLPPLMAPVPNLGSPAATMTAYPTEADKKNTGILVQPGNYLYLGLSQAITSPSPSSRVVMYLQGGFY